MESRDPIAPESEEGSITNAPPPDRSSSASAPPVLELAQESLFAFNMQYANLFTDIRATEEYYKFFEKYKHEKKLPPPLDPTPFLFGINNNFEQEDGEEQFRSKLDNFSSQLHDFLPTQQDSFFSQGQQSIHDNLNHGANGLQGPGLWAPLGRKATAIPINGLADDLTLQAESPSELQLQEVNFGSSPSAQTAFKSAQYIWKDEEQQDMGSRDHNFRHENGSKRNVSVLELDHRLSDGDDSLGQEEGISPRSGVICRYYAGGYCSRGDKCFYSHDTQVQSQPMNETKKVEKVKTPKQQKGAARTTNGHSPTKVLSPRAPEPIPTTPVKEKEKEKEREKEKEKTKVVEPDLSIPTSPQAYEQYTANFDLLIGKIYLISRDQQGCRFLQKKLEEQDEKVTAVIFSEVFPHINDLMIDPFGNYLCQKLLEHCNDQQKLKIAEKVSPHLVSISKNMHGTRAVQKMIECLSSPAQVQFIVDVLSDSVVDLIQDLNGNHVIQRCLNRLSPEENQFIYDAVTSGDNCVKVATHRHGCCVLQRCIDHGNEDQKVQLIEEITKNALTLVQDAYGNYVVQYVLELPFPHLVDILAKSFIGHVRQLATQKFSSNVVEKCLSLASHETAMSMIREMLQSDNLIAMLQDPYANYVVQTALTISPPDLHNQLVEAIKPHIPQLRNTPYGKRIQSKIAKESAEKAHKGKKNNHRA